MNKFSIVSESKLDNGRITKENYTSSLMDEAERVGLFTEEDRQRYITEITATLAEVIGYYTENSSSSLKKETARQLTKSIIYNIDTYLYSLKNHELALATLKDRRASELYGKGYLINTKYYETARILYGKVRLSRLANGSEEYNKTIDQYFRYYLTNYNAKFSSGDKIYLSLYKYGLTKSYHIDEAVDVLNELLRINKGRESDVILDVDSVNEKATPSDLSEE